MVTASRTNRQLAVFVNESVPGNLSAAGFSQQPGISTPNDPFALTIGDIDGDGANDIVTSSTGGANAVTVYRSRLVVSTNNPPVADAGMDQMIECSGEMTTVTLVGSASSDADGDALNYTWWAGETPIALGVQPTVNLSSGAHVIRLQVTDGDAMAEDTVLVTIADTVPPEVQHLTTTPSRLWPPNRKLVPVTVQIQLTDACDAAPTARIYDVISNEPVGNGKDWEIIGPLSVNLRAERLGTGKGRTYKLLVEIVDASGNKKTNSVSVVVPKSLARSLRKSR